MILTDLRKGQQGSNTRHSAVNVNKASRRRLSGLRELGCNLGMNTLEESIVETYATLKAIGD